MSNKSLDGVLTKKAHQRERFTEEQIADLASCSNPKTGFEYFASKFFYIQHPVEGKMLFKAFEVLRKSCNVLDMVMNYALTLYEQVL